MRAQNIQFLSIWEVAHRWEGLDPGASGDISITSKIGERLRAFWFEESEIEEAERRYLSHAQAPAVQTPKLRPEQEDKLKCQQIGRELWAKDRKMTIAAMCKRPEILIQGNGKAYKGKNTLRNWLKEV